MAKEAQSRSAYSIKEEKPGIGMVQIADDVVAAIAGIAAKEVEGVYSIASGNIQNEIARFRGRNSSKGVSVELLDTNVSVALSLIMDYGYSIPQVTSQVQDKVKTAIENMTGLSVIDVNIKVTGVNIDKSR
ncbi:MAG: Asp23/Gls24 family envelope stress response protein [Lachnospiraceae bacterium]|nr:Asp23/Gls24 family envelope stress response protein [Lachnospiraceae bacterium]